MSSDANSRRMPVIVAPNEKRCKQTPIGDALFCHGEALRISGRREPRISYAIYERESALDVQDVQRSDVRRRPTRDA